MTKIAISPNVSGTGTFTIAAPDSNTDRTFTLPDAAGVVATQEYIPTALNASGSAPIYACRAWVNFDGTGTVAIRDSGNVSSITDNGTGDYTVNFATAMQDINYSVSAISQAVGTTVFMTAIKQLSNASSFSIFTSSDLGVQDSPVITIAVFR